MALLRMSLNERCTTTRPPSNVTICRNRNRRHSSSQRDGSEQTIGELRGLLVVTLAAGSHTAALQWKAESTDDSVLWYVLNGIGGFFQVSQGASRVYNALETKERPTLAASFNVLSGTVPFSRASYLIVFDYLPWMLRCPQGTPWIICYAVSPGYLRPDSRSCSVCLGRVHYITTVAPYYIDYAALPRARPAERRASYFIGVPLEPSNCWKQRRHRSSLFLLCLHHREERSSWYSSMLRTTYLR